MNLTEEMIAKAKPILFNTEMVKAILCGIKTVTRRLIKPQPPKDAEGTYERMDNGNFQLKLAAYECISDYEIKPLFDVGDILYVRETWQKLKYKRPEKAIPTNFKGEEYVYLADHVICNSDGSKFKWKPSIHMPKKAARIFLRVTDIRAERLRDINDEDLIKEVGVDRSNTFMVHETLCRIDHMNWDRIEPLFVKFWNLWNSTIKKADLGKYGWGANPWVWVIEFERLDVKNDG